MNDCVSWSYQTFCRRYCCKEIGSYLSYGIRVIGTHRQSGIKVVREVHDVHPDDEVVSSLVALCNALELEPCHLNDVIRDWLGR